MPFIRYWIDKILCLLFSSVAAAVCCCFLQSHIHWATIAGDGSRPHWIVTLWMKRLNQNLKRRSWQEIAYQPTNKQVSMQSIEFGLCHFILFHFWLGVSCHKLWWRRRRRQANEQAKSIYWGHSSLRENKAFARRVAEEKNNVIKQRHFAP